MFPSRLVLILDELQESGLIERRAHTTDRRTYALHLTANGKKTLQTIAHIARQHEEALCAGLNKDERQTLARLLSRIAEKQQLRPGVHPGYRRLGKKSEKRCE
jgi:DNA-binding MarR family transcriptional regulator